MPEGLGFGRSGFEDMHGDLLAGLLCWMQPLPFHQGLSTLPS